jgi:WG containing repeat
VTPTKFDRIDQDFSEGLAAVSIHEKWGYIDPTGKVVIPLKFDQILSFHEGLGAASMTDKSAELIPFEENDKVGYKDRADRTVIPAKFERPEKLSRAGCIDTTGKLVFEF